MRRMRRRRRGWRRWRMIETANRARKDQNSKLSVRRKSVIKKGAFEPLFCLLETRKELTPDANILKLRCNLVIRRSNDGSRPHGRIADEIRIRFEGDNVWCREMLNDTPICVLTLCHNGDGSGWKALLKTRKKR